MVAFFGEETNAHIRLKLSTEQEVIAAASTPADAAIVKALQHAILALRGTQPKPVGIGGGTVAAFFRSANFPVAVWATQDGTLHGPNEYVKIDNIIADAKVFAHIALQDL